MSVDTLSGPTGGYRWMILLVATVAQTSACFLVQGIGVIGAFVQRDLHLTTAQVGLLISAAQLVPVVGLLVAGELLDRHSERLVVGGGTLIVALALLGASLAPGYLALLLFLIVVGAGYSTAQPGGSKSIARWFATSQRGFAMGIRQAGLPLGGALSAAILPSFANGLGWRSSLAAGGLVALLGAAVFLVFYRTPPGSAHDNRSSARSPRAGTAARLSVLRDRSMTNIMVSGLSLISVQYGILIFTVLYLHEAGGMTIERAALLLFAALAAGVAGRVVLALWSDRARSGRYFPVLICMGAVVVGLVLLMIVPLDSTPVVASLVAWLGFFGFGWYGPWVAYTAEIAPPGKTGFALGLAMAVNQVAVIVAPPALGLLKDTTGSYLPGWGTLAAIALLALIATARRARTGHRPA